MNDIPLRRDARWVITLVLATMISYGLVALLSFVWLFEEASTIPEYVRIGMQQSSLMEFALFLAGGIMWLIWLRRLNLRLRAAGREGMRFTPGWTVGWYFVPLANLYMPGQVMQEMWRASEPRAGATEWLASPPFKRIDLWWGLFIFGNIISRIGFGSAMSGENTGALVADPVSAAFIITAGVMAIGIIRQIEARMAVLEGTAVPSEPEPASVGGMIGAGFAGMALAIAWFVVMFHVISIMRPPMDFRVLVFIFQVIAGAGIGWMVLQATGRRGTPVLVTAGVTAFFSMLLANWFALRGPTTPMRLEFILGYLRSPFTLGMMLASAAAAIGIVLVKMPTPLWFLPRNPDATAAPVSPQGTMGAPAVLPPPPPPQAMSSQPAESVTLPPPPPAAPVETQPPPPPAAPVETQQPPPPPVVAPVASALPEPSPSPASQIIVPAQERDRSKVTLSVDRRWLFVGGAAVGLILVLVAAFALGRASRSPDSSTSPARPAEQQPIEQQPPQATAPDTADTDGYSGDEDTWGDSGLLYEYPRSAVEELYNAAGRGDEDGARSTFTFGFDVDPGTFEDWGDPKWQVRDIIDQPDGDCLIEVYEPDGGFSADRDVVTWIVRKQDDGGWLISGWWLGAAKDYRY